MPTLDHLGEEEAPPTKVTLQEEEEVPPAKKLKYQVTRKTKPPGFNFKPPALTRVSKVKTCMII